MTAVRVVTGAGAGQGVAGEAAMSIESSQSQGGRGGTKHSPHPNGIHAPASSTASTSAPPSTTFPASTASAHQRNGSLSNHPQTPITLSAQNSRSNSPNQTTLPTGPRSASQRQRDRQVVETSTTRNQRAPPRPPTNHEAVSVSIKDIAAPPSTRSRASSTTSTASSAQNLASRIVAETPPLPLPSTSATANSLLDRLAPVRNSNYKGKHPWPIASNSSARIPTGPRLRSVTPPPAHARAAPAASPRGKAAPPIGPKIHSGTNSARSEGTVPLVDRLGKPPQPVANANGATKEVDTGLLSRFAPTKNGNSRAAHNTDGAYDSRDSRSAQDTRVAQGASRGRGGIRGRGGYANARGGRGRGGQTSYDGDDRSFSGAQSGRESAHSLGDRFG